MNRQTMRSDAMVERGAEMTRVARALKSISTRDWKNNLGVRGPVFFKKVCYTYKVLAALSNTRPVAQDIIWRVRMLIVYFGNFKIHDIALQDIMEYVRRRLDVAISADGACATPGEIDAEIRCLCDVFEYAVGQKYLKRAPFSLRKRVA